MKSFWIVLTGRLLQMVSAFVALRVMTGLLGPEELGRFAIIISVTTFFALVFMNPAGMYVNRRLHSWNASASLLPHFAKFFMYIAVIAILAFFSIPTFQSLASPGWPLTPLWLAALVAGSLVFNTANQTLIPSLNLLNHRMAWLVLSSFTLLAALAFSILLSLREPTAESWQLGQILGFALGALVSIPVFRRYVNRTAVETARRDSLGQVVSFAAPLALSVGLYWCQFQSYRLFVGHWITLETLGGFAGVYTLVAGLMAAYENLIQQYLYPKLYSESSTDDHGLRSLAWTRYATLAIPLSALAGLALYSAHSSFIHLFLAPSFHRHAEFAAVAVLVETCRVIGSAYGMAGQLAYRTKTLLIPQLIAVGLLFGLTPVLFSNAAVATTDAFLISLGVPAMVYMVISAFITRSKLGMSFALKAMTPVAIAAVATFVLISIGTQLPASRLGDGLRIAISGLVFSVLGLWVVRNWRRLESPKVGPLKVVHIVRAPAGGIRLHILELMQTNAVEQWLLTDTNAGDFVFNDKMKQPSFASRVLHLSIAESPGLSDLSNLIKIFFKLSKLQPDILHGHGAKGGLYARLLASPLGAKAVYSAHGGSLHQVFSPLKQRLYVAIEKLLAPWSDALVFESDYSRTRYLESISRRESSSFLVPNGLSLPPYVGARKESRPFVVGAFGLLRPLKGQDLLIEAAGLLKDRGVECEVRIYGEGPSRSEYETLISRLGLDRFVSLKGDTSDPYAHMSECDLIAQPSRFESFGYTAVEAMALGIPLVASAVGGLKEIVSNEKTGLLVSDLTPKGFADAIERLAHDPQLRATLAAEARRIVESRYDSKRMRDQIVEIYRTVCSASLVLTATTESAAIANMKK